MESYQRATQGKHKALKPGDRIPLKGVSAVVVASDGKFLSRPDGKANPFCADATLKQEDPTENGKSVGFLLTMGKFEFVNLGDMTWNNEHRLACPENRIGEIDLFQVSHHGVSLSGAPQLVWALKPKVAVMNNGPRNGAAPEVLQMFRNSPEFEDLWQLHGGQSERVANPNEGQCAGHWIRVSVKADGSYTVTNSRNGLSKTYTSR